MKQVADTRPARELLGWQAITSLDDGLRQTIEWYRQAQHRAALPASLPDVSVAAATSERA
jgi:dTDP-D-glucose 4,6-dehydratase